MSSVLFITWQLSTFQTLLQFETRVRTLVLLINTHIVISVKTNFELENRGTSFVFYGATGLPSDWSAACRCSRLGFNPFSSLDSHGFLPELPLESHRQFHEDIQSHFAFESP